MHHSLINLELITNCDKVELENASVETKVHCDHAHLADLLTKQNFDNHQALFCEQLKVEIEETQTSVDTKVHSDQADVDQELGIKQLKVTMDEPLKNIETRITCCQDSMNNVVIAQAADEKSDKTRIYIMTLSVLAAYRNRGIGQKLVQSVIDYHTKSINRGNDDSDGSNNDNTEDKLSPITIEDHKLMQNVQEMTLHVQISNQDAIKFYTEKFDFEQGEQIENYYKRIDPPHCFVLRKRL